MIYLVLLVGGLLRLINLDQSLWLDEGITVQTVRSFSFIPLITEFPKFDLHPPGHYLLLFFWTAIFGISEISLRIPSLVMGVITIFLVWKIGIEMSSKKVALIAAWLLAINPLHIYYSQEARMYSMGAMVVLLNFYYFHRLLKNGSWLGYSLSTVLVLMTDYIIYFSFVGQLLILVLWYKDRFGLYLKSIIPGGVIFGAWVPMFYGQIQSGSGLAGELPVWQRVVGSFDIKALGLTAVKFMLGRISLVDKFWYALLAGFAGVMYGIGIGRAILSNDRNTRIILVMAFCPIILAWLFSTFLPIYSYFRVLYCLPFVLLVLSIGLCQLQRVGKVLVVVISLVSIVSSGYYLINSSFHREDWKGLVQFLSTKQTDDSVVVFESNGSFAPFDYYNMDKIDTKAGLLTFPAKDSQNIANLSDKNITKIYLLEYLIDISDPQRLLIENLKANNWIEEKVYDFRGVGFVREWSRK